MFSMRGWVSESYAPSCTSLTPSMRGVTRSHIKGGVDLLLSFKSVCIQLWAMQFSQVRNMDSIISDVLEYFARHFWKMINNDRFQLRGSARSGAEGFGGCHWGDETCGTLGGGSCTHLPEVPRCHSDGAVGGLNFGWSLWVKVRILCNLSCIAELTG